MKICCLQKTTLLDFPGHVAATIFLGGCNFRCPFCHNSSLIGGDAKPQYSEEEVIDFLIKRKGILEGVCITGGEPTLSSDLEPFIRKVRELGYLIKLDTNGHRPEVLKHLISNELLDYVAMDIKSGREQYKIASGNPNLLIKNIEESAAFLMEHRIFYEFRTTVVNGIHTKADFLNIGHWLKGDSLYYLQNYVDSEEVLCPGYSSFSDFELNEFLKILKPYLPKAAIRGDSF